jgi:sugar phosphate isomerase/epimerase
MEVALAHPYDYTLPLDVVFKAIAEGGFRITSLGANRDHTRYHTPEGIKFLKELCSRYHLRIHNIHTPLGDEQRISSPDEEMRKAGVEEVTAAIDACSELGAGMIVLHLSHRAGAVEYEARLDSARRSFSQIITAAEKAGIKVACENLFSLDSNAILKRILNEFAHPLAGLCYDTSHANLTDNPMEFLEEYGDRLFITHISDNRGVHDDHLIPGFGKIDWPAMMKAIRGTGFEGPLLLEVERQSSGYSHLDPFEFTMAAYERAEWLRHLFRDV